MLLLLRNSSKFCYMQVRWLCFMSLKVWMKWETGTSTIQSTFNIKNITSLACMRMSHSIIKDIQVLPPLMSQGTTHPHTHIFSTTFFDFGASFSAPLSISSCGLESKLLRLPLCCPLGVYLHFAFHCRSKTIFSANKSCTQLPILPNIEQGFPTCMF